MEPPVVESHGARRAARVGVVGRISFAAAALGAVVFGAYAVWLARAETAELLADERREMGYAARSLQVAVENALRDGSGTDITETLATLELEDSAIDVLVFDASGSLRHASAGVETPAPALVRLADEASRGPVVRVEPAVGFPRRMVVGLPLVPRAGEPAGSLLLSRPLDGMATELRRLAVSAASGLAVVVALVGAGAFLIGRLLVGRPLAALLDAIGDVRAGARDVRLDTGRADEIARVGDAFRELVHELRAAEERLAAEAAHRASALAALQRADRLASVGTLSAMLAHEIASPLQVLIGRAEDLARESQDPKVRREGEIVAAQGRRIAGIVDRLLGFARRRPNAARGACDLVREARDIAELVRPQFERRGVRLDLDGLASSAAEGVALDADSVQQVVFNLLTNALLASPRGGRVRLAVDPAEAPDRVRLVVADEGPGIPEALREQVFEPFFTTRSNEGGSGLGLAVVRELVRAGRGEVRIDAAAGGGAALVVELPRVGGRVP